jgi:hypothetical protein
MVSILLAATSAAAQGPVAWYPLDGNANDLSGNGNNGTVNGAVPTSDRFGNINSAYSFNGVSDFISIPASADFGFNLNENYSISTWVKYCDHGVFATVAVGLTQTDPGVSFGISGWTSAAFAGPTGTVAWEFTPAAPLADGKWHHLVAVFINTSSFGRPASSTVFYVDGQLFSTVDPSSSLNHLDHPKSWNNPGRALIGWYNDPSTFFMGAIDDVRLYKRELSPAEITALYGERGWPATATPVLHLTVAADRPTTICSGDSVMLTAVTSGPGEIDLRWGSADGLLLSDRGKHVVWVKPTETTTYTVRATSGQPCADRDTSASITINVNQAPRVSLGGARYVCEGEGRITIGDNATGGLPPYTYSWSPATGLSDPSAARPTLIPSSPITYTLTVTDAKGCRSVQSMSIVVLPTPRITLGADRVICRGDSLTLDAGKGAPPGYSYHWSPAAGLSDTAAAAPKVRPDTTTTYVVRAEVGGCAGYDTITIRVLEHPLADAGPDVETCPDSGVVIGRATGANYTYIWAPSTGLSDPASPTPTASPAATTTYRVMVIDTAGCTSADEVTVTVRKSQLSVNGSAVKFGLLDRCTSSKEMTVRLINSGTGDITIGELLSDNASFGIVAPPVGTLIKAGAKVALRLRYAPVSAGPATGHLRVRGMPCGAEVVIDADGSREAGAVSAGRSTIDYGRTLACRTVSSDSVIMITNNGVVPVELRPGTVAPPFAIVSPSLPATIAAGGSLAIIVRYAPVAAGSYADELRLPYNVDQCEDTIRVSLSGLHQRPLMSAPASIGFGALIGCETRRDTTIELINTGGVDAEITGGDAGNGFELLTPLPMTIAAGERSPITVRFAPAASGAGSGSLVLRYGPCNDSLTIALAGIAGSVSFSAADSLDLGEVISCAANGSSIATSLLYMGDPSVPGIVRDARITGPFTTSLTTGTAIASGTSTSFTVGFQPTADGPANGLLTLTIDPCGLTRTIALRGLRTSAALTAATSGISFGTQAPGSVAQQDILFTNTGGTPLHVVSVDGVIAPFSVVSTTPILPVDLAPAAPLRVTIRSLGMVGSRRSPIRVHVTVPCDIFAEVMVDAEGADAARAALRFPMVTAAAGDRIHLPLLLDSSSGLDAAGATAFTATVSFDRSLLVAADPIMSTSDGTTRRVTFSGERTAGDASGTIGYVDLIAVFGSAESTPLHLDTIIWTRAVQPVALDRQDGELRLDGICRSGGTRLYNGAGDVALKPVQPNPVGSVAAVEYEVVETGRTRLVLSDLLGREVGVLADGDLEPGRYIAWIDVRGIASGYYFCVLKTPTLILTQPMEVAR